MSVKIPEVYQIYVMIFCNWFLEWIEFMCWLVIFDFLSKKDLCCDLIYLVPWVNRIYMFTWYIWFFDLIEFMYWLAIIGSLIELEFMFNDTKQCCWIGFLRGPGEIAIDWYILFIVCVLTYMSVGVSCCCWVMVGWLGFFGKSGFWLE